MLTKQTGFSQIISELYSVKLWSFEREIDTLIKLNEIPDCSFIELNYPKLNRNRTNDSTLTLFNDTIFITI